LDLLIPAAYAQSGAPAQQPSALMTFLPLIVMVPLLYFLMIRPQQKRNREQREMTNNLSKGDEVVVNGGLAGKVTGVGEVYLTVEIADGVNVKIQKAAVSSVLPKGTLKNL
jgi:preprotein translocase subunit YajC